MENILLNDNADEIPKNCAKKPAKNDWFSAGSSISPDGKKFFCNHQDLPQCIFLFSTGNINNCFITDLARK
ncbi:hypothetical protein [Parageobacillus thermoglucosidasius]|uniref:hypothetical protein n=1 Tax=Parageobacillus thermoglucosidasius TaxID=1426 RepID=UPI0002D4619A|nr:hypothetical protein [Parageobacillus thermoglucosidasius]